MAAQTLSIFFAPILWGYLIYRNITPLKSFFHGICFALSIFIKRKAISIDKIHFVNETIKKMSGCLPEWSGRIFHLDKKISEKSGSMIFTQQYLKILLFNNIQHNTKTVN